MTIRVQGVMAELYNSQIIVPLIAEDRPMFMTSSRDTDWEVMTNPTDCPEVSSVYLMPNGNFYLKWDDSIKIRWYRGERTKLEWLMKFKEPIRFIRVSKKRDKNTIPYCLRNI